MTESSPDLKTTEVTGHQPNCCVSLGHLPCTCTHSLAERLAVRMGTWRKEHEWTSRPNDGGGFDEVCGYCGSRAPDPGSCYPPLDDALAWRLFTSMPPEDVGLGHDPNFVIPAEPWWAMWEDSKADHRAARSDHRILRHSADPIEAIALLWIALKDAGLLEE